MKFSRNPISGEMEAYTDDGVYMGNVVTMGDLIGSNSKSAQDGGPGSGNHGHAGRPGKVGGSAPEGVEGGSVSNAAKIAKSSKEFYGSLSSSEKSKMNTQRKKTKTKETPEEYASRIYEDEKQIQNKPQKHKIAKGRNLENAGWKLGKGIDFGYDGPFIDGDEEKPDPSALHKFVLKLQGFDGPPKVLSDDEYKEYVKKNDTFEPMIRCYGALTEEDATAMDESLNQSLGSSGSGGGKKYGRGLYVGLARGETKETAHRGFGDQAVTRLMGNYGQNFVKSEDDTYECTAFGGRLHYWIFPKNPDYVSFKDKKPEEGQKITYFEKGFFGNIKGVGIYENGKIKRNDYSYRDGAYGFESTTKTDGDIKWAPIKEEITPDFNAVTSTREMTLDPSAKIISDYELKKKFPVVFKIKGEFVTVEDEGTAAAVLGYDAIDTGQYVSIINKTKMILNGKAHHESSSPHIK